MDESPLRILDDLPPPARRGPVPVDPARLGPPRDLDDPAILILTCANCGAAMDERKCKLICPCGYFLSCSDYY